MKTVQHLIGGSRLKLHIVFGIMLLALLLAGNYFLYVLHFRFDSFGLALLRYLFFFACVYTGRWLCMRWYLHNKWLLFIFYTCLSAIIVEVPWWLIVKYALNHPYAGFLEVLLDTLPFYLIGLVLGILLKLIRVSIQKELQDAHIKAEQKESEFGLLQSQLSPHFLFNVLNNLYGISIAEHERIPPLLLKLSELLRYSVYGAKKTFVPLREELDYIKNYIEFEKIRISDRLNLSMEIDMVDNPEIKIAPLILIVFIENAFKHSKNTFNKEIDIDISIKISGNFICLRVSNSYDKEQNKNGIFDENSGLGLDNTLKRLGLLYGDDYELKQDTENELYHVSLRLKIKK